MTILAPQQHIAVTNFKKWFKDLPQLRRSDKFGPGTAPDFLLEGYAGTGKSTILPFLIESAGLTPEQCLFVAPTGKASKVMTKKLRAQGMVSPATTIHRAIYRPKALQANVLERQLADARYAMDRAKEVGDQKSVFELDRKVRQLVKDLNRAYDSDAPSFQLNVDAENIRAASLVVVDECSMVGEEMAEDIRSFGTPILAIGDPGQLPPVQDLPGFCNRVADYRLTEVHRQAADNPIIWASMLVREGKPLPVGEHGDGLLRVIERKDDDVTFDLTRDVQIITGTNNKRWQITRKIRDLSGYGPVGPQAGEMMIVVKNSRKFPELVNGTMVMMNGNCGELSRGDTTFSAEVMDEDQRVYPLRCVQSVLEENYLGKGQFTASKRSVFQAKQEESNHQIDWGYAITCHKSQGSQWPEVVVHNEAGTFRDDARKWLYTAITRASEKLTVIEQ